MATSTSRLKWGRILVGGLLAWVGSFLLVFLIVTGFALKLGFEARGAPDQARIQHFAERIGPTWGPALLAILTLAAAFWVARKAVASRSLHGALVGLVAGVGSLIVALPPSLGTVSAFGVTLLAGWLGGAAAARQSGSTSPSSQTPEDTA